MKHLTADEIINFVTMNTLSKESLELAAMVNSHILVCDECREKVEAYQAVSDTLTGTLALDCEQNKPQELDK